MQYGGIFFQIRAAVSIKADVIISLKATIITMYVGVLLTAKLCCVVQVISLPLPSNRHHRSNGGCLEDKRENYQVCSVQYCVQQLCTVRCTHTYEQT